MKKLLVFCCWLLSSSQSNAHPGIGIVKDSKGNIYYTDLKQVWKISIDGSKTPVVKGVHTHELFIDALDNLYGEHLWYNGESKNTWGHYAWCLKSSGELVNEIKPTEGFLSNYSFTRDSSGNMYWVQRFTTSRIMKKSKSGEISNVIEGKFGFIGWLFATKNGHLYFTENSKLHQITPAGQLKTIAENIGSKSTDFTVMGRNYDSYGIWTDNAENVYIAMIDSRKVIRIDKAGKLHTVITGNSMWTICSGLFDSNGDLWVLENSAANQVRARKISQQELLMDQAPIKPGRRTHVLITVLTGIAIIILVFPAKVIVRQKSSKQIHLAI